MTTPAVGQSPQPSPPQTDTAAPQPDEQQQSQPEPEPDTAATDATDDADDGGQDDDADRTDDEDHQDDGSDKSKASREAARYRVQLREARDQNVTLAAALGLQQQAVVDVLVKSAGFDPAFSKLMESNGAELDSLTGDDGMLDLQKVTKAIGDTARTYGLRPNTGPRPTPGQGQHGGVGGGTSTWAEVFEQATRR
jgi:hypothetical protein